MKTYFSGVADRNSSSNSSRGKIQQKLNEKFVVFVSALEFELAYFLRSNESGSLPFVCCSEPVLDEKHHRTILA